PVWDGNEVWLITAGAVLFAAFPHWYASLFAGLYLPLVLVLLALIFRAVGFEYRGKIHSDRWRNGWDWAIALGSLVSAFGGGAMLALTTTGLPLDANGDRVGGPFAWLNGYAVLGGLAVVGFCLVHALAFLMLKTDGEVRHRARRALRRWLPAGLAPLALWAILVVAAGGKAAMWLLLAVGVAAAAGGWKLAGHGKEGPAFAGLGIFLVAGAAAIFASVYPTVLPSTIDPSFDLTVAGAASSPYTLGVMSVVALFGIPAVLAYQLYTYWVFRRRVGPADIPAAHAVRPQ
ncbi:cytochrome d ubiquinol oxidase subunit II, partial [Arthrobacter deserti]|nr:cytochrome d ubiquinol oxidase subunit II [Arthrobacter deserti]